MSEVTVEVAAQDRDLWRYGGGVVAAAFVLWLVPSTALILKYTGLAGLILVPLAGLAAIIVLTTILCRRTVDLSARWLVGHPRAHATNHTLMTVMMTFKSKLLSPSTNLRRLHYQFHVVFLTKAI